MLFLTVKQHQEVGRRLLNRVEEAVYRACDLLADSPLLGRTRKELTSLPLRFWVVHPYSNYLIVYPNLEEIATA